MRMPATVTFCTAAMVWTAAACGGLLAGTGERPDECRGTANRFPPARLDEPRLVNPLRIAPGVISGGMPDEAGFEALAELGVKTVISVDGALPDAELARRFGLRYVHLPHGYDGIPRARARELAKAVRDLEGPVFIHCHHGKHRSPVAAVTACVMLGWLDPTAVDSVLRAAGTSEGYRGLYRTAREARRVDGGQLDMIPANFTDRAKVPALAEAMVALERAHDRLRLIAAAQWQPPQDRPDLDPRHEVLLLREQFAELLRTAAVQEKAVEFERWLRDSNVAAGKLEAALDDRSDDAPGADNRAKASRDQLLREISDRCQICHRQFRD